MAACTMDCDAGDALLVGHPSPTPAPLASLLADPEFADVHLVPLPEDGDGAPAPLAPTTPPRPGAPPRARSPSRAASAHPCHRAVLAAASPYFRSMFASSMVESKPGARVTLVGVDAAALARVLTFVYTGAVALPRAAALDVAALADRLDVPSLRAALSAALDADLGPGVAAHYLPAAAAAGRDDLVDRCLDALASDWAAAAASPSFPTLDEPSLAALLTRDDLAAPSEADVARSLLAWGEGGGGGGGGGARAAAVARLAARVRWGAVAPADLAGLAAHPAVAASPPLREYVLRGFLHIHGKPTLPTLPAPRGGGAGDDAGPHAAAVDAVALPPRGGPAARLRLRVVVADGDCPWPAAAGAPPCPPDRPCPCPPPPGAPPRGVTIIVSSRDATVASLKARACRDAGVPGGDADGWCVWDFYGGARYGRAPLDDGPDGATCAEVDLRDGQAVLLERRAG